MSETNIVSAILAEFERLFTPLLRSVESAHARSTLFDRMGWDGAVLVNGAVETAITEIGELIDLVVDLADGELSDFGAIIDAIDAVGGLIQACDQLGEAASNGTLATLLDATVIGELAEDLLASLVVRYLKLYHPAMYLGMLGLTLIDPDAPKRTQLPATGPGPVVRRAVSRVSLRPDHLVTLFQDPIGHFTTFHFGGAVDAAGMKRFSDRVLSEVASTLVLHDIDAMYGYPRTFAAELGLDPADPFVERLLTIGFELPPIEGAGATAAAAVSITSGLIGSDEQGGPALVLIPFGELEISRPTAGWEFTLGLSGTAGGVALGPAGVTVGQGSAASGRLELGVTKGGSGAPAFLFGPAQGTRVELGQVHLRTGIDLSTTGATFDLEAGIKTAQIVVAAGDGDGFLQNILPPGGFRVPFELVIGFVSPDRVYFAGGAGLDIELPVGIDLFGVIKIPVIGLQLKILVPQGQPPAIAMAVTATVEVDLGPFFATVEGMGLALELTFPPSGGNLGGANLQPKFKPPRGIGMRIAAGPVIGGGYLYLDFDKGEYAGVLQVKIGPLGLTVIGLLNTVMPDGTAGFSLVLIVCCDFPPIQLGYGFTLNGAGGILGVNRTVNVPALQDGVRRGALDSILFPKDAVTNARQIIRDVGTIFPPTADQFVIGPMIKIGWGPQPIITASIGIVIEFPRFTLSLLGLIELGLPTIDAPVVLLRLAVVGILDPGRGELSIDATLDGSFVTVFSISGDVALRLRWKGESMFAIAAGGFHPRFEPPAGFPQLDRLAIALADSDNPRIRLETYLALTPATVQLGAKLEAYVALDLGPIGSIEVDAGFGFDTLIRFSPFSFEVDIFGYAMIKRNGAAWLSASIEMHLSGPSPWHALGAATVNFFGEHKVAFEVTAGEPAAEPLPPAVDLAAAVRAAVGDARSWAALPPADAPVRLRTIVAPAAAGTAPPPQPLLVHPAAALVLRQSAAPLDRDLQKAGEAPLTGPTRIHLDAVLVGPDATAATIPLGDAVTDQFAPSQFFELSDDQRLTGPAFEPLPSGAFVGSGSAVWGATSTLTDDVEVIVVDADDRIALVATPLAFLGLVTKDATANTPGLPSAGWGVLGVGLKPVGYRVVTDDDATDGALVATAIVYSTWIAALQETEATSHLVVAASEVGL